MANIANTHHNRVIVCEQALLFGRAKQASRERASEGTRKGELATISHKFLFPPQKPRDSSKRENGHVPPIRKVTTANCISLRLGEVQMKFYERSLQTLLSSAPCDFAARSRVLARLASLAQIGELARRLTE